MGMNVSLYNLSQVKDPTYPWSDVIHDERFDCSRYTGDREFIAWLIEGENGEYRSLGQERDIEVYERPSNIQQAREWVCANIVECNHARWFDLFTLLEADTEKHLWLQESW